MKITILTTFPEMFTPLHTSMLGRAEKAGILEIREVDIRAYSKNKHHNTDDAPFGGGAGMAPMRSHLMHLFKTEKTDRPVSFWYGARALKEVPYLDEFHQIEKDFPNFSFNLALDRPDPEADAAGVKYTLRAQRALRKLPQEPPGSRGLHLPHVRTSDDDRFGRQDARQPRRAAGEYLVR